MATFSIPNLSDRLNFFGRTAPFLFWKSSLKPVKNWKLSFFATKRSFGGWFEWNRCAHFQMICSWARLIVPNASETRQSSWSGSSVFALEKWSKNLNFHSFFTSNRPFGGNFQWKACIYFQKLGSWIRYSDAILIKNISKFLVALLRFSFWKTT